MSVSVPVKVPNVWGVPGSVKDANLFVSVNVVCVCVVVRAVSEYNECANVRRCCSFVRRRVFVDNGAKMCEGCICV